MHNLCPSCPGGQCRRNDRALAVLRVQGAHGMPLWNYGTHSAYATTSFFLGGMPGSSGQRGSSGSGTGWASCSPVISLEAYGEHHHGNRSRGYQ